MLDNKAIADAMTIKLDAVLPDYPEFQPGIRRAPDRGFTLNQGETETALKNALRYVPEELHEALIPEFLHELHTRGRIYGYRFRPAGPIKAQPIDAYQGCCIEGKAFQVMIDNNLDFAIALYPYELVTYGETGQVCQNWMQYRLIKKYLEVLTQDQTLVVMSGHPLGLFRSNTNAPRVIMSHGLMIGMFDNQPEWHRAMQLGVANYGQMTAGGWMYIGPQGIVHGTFNTILNAGRMKLGIAPDEDLAGHLFVSSGLGGMSGAQPKAVEIANGVGIIAEVDESRINTRHEQGWVAKIARTPAEAFELAHEHMRARRSISIAFHGNIVDLLEHAVKKNIPIELLSDQTSCHAVYDGGYCPQGLTFAERTEMIAKDPARFKEMVDATLKAHFKAIKTLCRRGTYFFDYGNAFMRSVFDAGVPEICANGENPRDGFIWPSYVEDIMGPMLFDYGYGPFRWVCLSGSPEDLAKTDQAAMACIDPGRRAQDRDNYVWIRDAAKNALVVGTQARILYQDAEGRVKIALRFNDMVRKGEIGPIMLGRDHHDTGGTDSPYRETANIKDGSNIMAEMATHCYAGNAARGMSLISLHNGGGVGIGKSINGGFGLVLDGSSRVDEIILQAITWDTMCGVSRRAWGRCENAIEVTSAFNRGGHGNHVTLPFIPAEDRVKKAVADLFAAKK
ncbi:MAG TPA: urocanate hydratase [Candidatus Rifleibacterium sp.]|nr:urocanate hydratase [Candidatus Rifleibacterium sp.]HPT44952.1 urocanate hydratase [Candidatus Rifleibacterium sp.]